MSDKERIEIGDIVTICVDANENFVYVEAKILDTPAATGDAWKIKTRFGSLVYIQQYHCMTLIQKKIVESV
ncbi:hypothetical protein CH379_019535 [Leptospira ellisii]|uniref:Uncharacterized protein n=1 Tax=Leptospira ellisii TaxID=2023197 RepID=A0A2N0B7R8_9LEPT|nr:hypothetical protein [Leptospira ellisii]MDV6237824.1 hypothetical protein [Leptospira ellisii]PJZ92580.1 hypothetical protein CH379_12310 [Leptospira ellisii]PKA03664.1 hypothetical protein CH375_15665 [Leptospira ellisii]